MRYHYIAFDVDGTLLDTERNELTTLGRLVEEETGRRPAWETLLPTFGMTAGDALIFLGCTPDQAARIRTRWHDASVAAVSKTPLFAGLNEALETLDRAGVKMGIVTSRGKSTVDLRFSPEREGRYFPVRICQQDTIQHKPAAEPLLRWMECMGARPEQTLYVGDTASDMGCAANACVDSALALWGTRAPKLACTWRLETPADLVAICLGGASE